MVFRQFNCGGQDMAPHTYELPPREQRHHWLRFLDPYYTALILHSVETRLLSRGTFLGRPPSTLLLETPRMRLVHRLIPYTIAGRGHAPEKVYVVNLSYLRSMDKGTVNVPYMLASFLVVGASERKHGAMMAGGNFIGHLAEHFGLVSDAGLAGLTVIS
ncbi:hypothetical protein Tco_0811851 [Tanacetum coccineum]